MGDLVSVGTLFAFLFVSTAVLVPCHRRPEAQCGFRVPGRPVITIIVNLLLVALVPLPSVAQLLAWFAIGIVVFLLVSKHRMRSGAATMP
ncbi:MAG: hypothetical protein ACRDTC_20385 [Pseudonocardiaceae bacterium]